MKIFHQLNNNFQGGIKILKKFLYCTIGWIAIGLGVLGIFLPLLPTTPFLLLAVFCFEKGSKKFYDFTLNNKILGKYIRDYREKKGVTLKNKVIAISVMTLGIGSTILSTDKIIVKIILGTIFIGVTIHLLKLNTLKD